ncbi:MAG: cytochrome c oxidase subunit 3 [Candidatus Hodarchaeales archaeon]|jgi:heme/copper-type cytochrome/quinol oxidase subunit 3
MEVAIKLSEIHPILVHFHIALYAFSVLCTIIAFILTIFRRLGLFNNGIVERLSLGKLEIDENSVDRLVDRVEFTSFFGIIIATLSIVPAAIAGFLDAGGAKGVFDISLEAFLSGILSASLSQTLSFKVIHAFFGVYFFVFAGIMRVYYVNYRHERLYDQHFLIQIIVLISQVVGFFILTMVAGAGAIIVFGGTTLEELPFIDIFLPGKEGNLLPLILVTSLLFVVLIILAGFNRKASKLLPVSEHVDEHEATLWPPALALSFGLVAYAIILFAQGQLLTAIALVWIFFIIVIAFIFKETYKQELLKKVDHTWIWVFLASEVVFFTMLIGLSFGFRIASTGWPNPGDTLNVPLTAINTFILIISSFTMVKAVEAIQNNKPKWLRNYLFMTFGLGATFMSIQVMEYLALFEEGFTPASSLFGSTFYIQTGFHGAHVFVGILLILFIALKAARGGYTKEHHDGVELVGIYWHFVDLVWIILFTLVYLI